MSVTGPGSRPIRPDEPETTPEGDRLLAELESARGRGSSAMSALDTARGLRPLANELARDGKLDAADVKRLVTEAKDYQTLTRGEKDALKRVVRELGDKFTPDALEALSRFVGVARTRPTGPTAPTGGVDTDKDLVTDDVEKRYGLDPTKPRTFNNVPQEKGWDIPGSGYGSFSDDFVTATMGKFTDIFGGTAAASAGRGYWEMYASGDKPLPAGSWIPEGGNIQEDDFEATSGVDITGDRPIGDDAYRLLRDAAAPQDAKFVLRDGQGKNLDVRTGDKLVPMILSGGQPRQVELRMEGSGAKYFDPATGKAATGEVAWRLKGSDGKVRTATGEKAEGRETLVSTKDGVKFDFLDEMGDPIAYDRAAGDKIVPTWEEGGKKYALLETKDGAGRVTGYEKQTLDAAGKKVASREQFDATAGKALLDRVKGQSGTLYRIETRSGELKGDGKVGEYYNMSWWGRCQNVATIDQSGLKEPTKEVKLVTNLNRAAGEEIGARYKDGTTEHVLVPKRDGEGKVTGYEDRVGGRATATLTPEQAAAKAKEKGAENVIVARDGSVKAAETKTVTKEEAKMMTALMDDGASEYKGSIGARFYGVPDEVRLKDGKLLSGRIVNVETAAGKKVQIQARSGDEWDDQNGGILRGADLKTGSRTRGWAGQVAWADTSMDSINAGRSDKIKTVTIEYPDGRTEKVAADKVGNIGRENANDLSPADLWKAATWIKDGKSLTIEKSQGVQVWNYGVKEMGTERVDRTKVPSRILEKDSDPGAMAGTTDKDGRVYFKTDGKTLQGGSMEYYYWVKMDKDGTIKDYNFLNGQPDFFWQSHVKDPVTTKWDGEANVPGASMRDIQGIYNASTGAYAPYEVLGALSTDDLKNRKPVKP